MRKWLSWVLTMAIVIGSVSVAGFVLPALAYVAGDVNLDGVVTTYDARLLLTSLVSNVTLSSAQQQAADINGDGDVNTTDIKTILDVVMNADDGDLAKDINLLAGDIDAWNNPVQTTNGSYCTVKQVAATDGVSLVNATETDLRPGYTGNNPDADPYTWPSTGYAYESRYLAPADAVIEYDFTVTSEAASVQLYLGGFRPFTDDEKHPINIALNSFITSSIDAASGDLKPGVYNGMISVGDLLAVAPKDAVVNDKLWISGIKVFIVGHNNDEVVLRKFKLSKAYQSARGFDVSSDPYQVIKSDYVFSSETAGLSTLTGLEVHQNGERTLKNAFNYSADNKKIYYTETEKRIMNYPDGYQIDIPLDWEPDFSLSALRTQYESDTCVLTVSKEEENPYTSWETYRDEWLTPYIGNQTFLDSNLMRYTREPVVSETWLSGYTVMTYDIAIDWQGDIDMPYYSIAIIRKFYTYDTFYLLVLKSSAPTEGMIDRLIRSFKEITVYGTPVNVQGQYEQIIPETWSDETKAYYNKLCTQNSTDWGFFSHSMVEMADQYFGQRYDFILSEKERIETAIGYEYDILPTYTHLGWGDSYRIPFPLDMAEEFAGGNGFNGKPVLQFTYQFTLSNNTNLTGLTPIYNVLRGDYDDHFRQLAQDIKEYGKPILFRLNNEMNTDWTSYCGLVSLLDPDIFVLGWQHLYDIFQEEGVDNCIWIFNPFTPTTPYSSWGETLCYMPGAEYVQILGLTNYEMGNSSTVASFYTEYTEVYNDSKDYFLNLPWVISEFACGAGGEKSYNYTYDYWQNTTLGRNAYNQATYVSYMFYYLNNRNSYPFCKNIKAAVWFNRNDYVQIDGVDYIVNYLELSSSALSAFKSGLAGK